MTATFIQRDEDTFHRRETNIYATIIDHDGRVVERNVRPEDEVVHYWKEDCHAPPIKPSFDQGGLSGKPRTSNDIESPMYFNPLYSGPSLWVGPGRLC